ncbi:MAG: hypothetical protein Q8880_05595 [Bacteroidota bacterium]|nr:hypothetical protein [Bacteroidota bacterium]
MRKYIIFNFNVLIISSLFLLFSCKKDTLENTSNDDKLFFPSNIGHYVIYDVDSSYIFQGKSVKTHFQVKELIESNFLDNSNRNTQRIERYIRLSDTANWVLSRVWYSNLTASSAERIEENMRYVKLIFPISQWKQWNKNVYVDTVSEIKSQYTSVFTSYNVNGINFPNTVTVSLENDSSIIHKNYNIEVYAKNVGMIYRQMIYLRKKIDDSGNFIFDSDNECTYKIINYN